MHNKAGYLMLEFLLYFFIMTLIIMLAMQWASASHLVCMAFGQENADCMRLSAAQDVLVRDIQQALASTKDWKKQGPTEYVWSVGTIDVGWQLSENKLVRTQGVYNVGTATWSEGSHGLIADRVDDFVLTIMPGAHQTVRSVVCHLEGRVGGMRQALERTVYLRNGEVV